MEKSKSNICYRSIIHFVALTILFVGLICLFKYIVLNIILKDVFEYSNALFSLTIVKNTGAAFSLLTSHTNLLINISFFVLFGISAWVIYYSSTLSKLELFSVSLLISGVLLNLYERISLGFVVDYIKLNFVSFPIFNFSDVAIVLGAVLYIVVLYTKRD